MPIHERLMRFDSEDMRQRGIKGGKATARKYPKREYMAKARAAFMSRFDGDPEAKRAYFSELAHKSVAARRRKKLEQPPGETND